MAQPRGSLDPNKLVEAAEAALMAVVQTGGQHGARRPYPLDLMGTAAQPGCLASFTRIEIKEACEFLVRLGFLDPPRPRDAA